MSPLLPLLASRQVCSACIRQIALSPARLAPLQTATVGFAGGARRGVRTVGAARVVSARKRQEMRSALLGAGNRGIVEQEEAEAGLEGKEAEESAAVEETVETEAVFEMREERIQMEEEEGVETVEDAPSQTSSVPWYLQEHPPVHRPIISTPLPDIPPNPPSILEPLIKHLDDELGISHLALLDLRPISSSQPLSLGSNLIMLFGTARSERHLHISADKLCRWVRSNFGELTPHADGLMGRNEIKLRERRRRRRGKVSSQAVGEMLEENRIGWVCVTVGEGVVVQMFTGERREELDLEGLWKSRLEAEVRKMEKLREKMVREGLIEGGVVEAAAAAVEEGSLEGEEMVGWKPVGQKKDGETIRS